MVGLKVCLRNCEGQTLLLDEKGQWLLDGNPISQERAILDLIEVATDLEYWQQVAKEVLPDNQFQLVQETYES